MLYREIIAVCSQMHTKHKYTVWAERVMLGAFAKFRKQNISLVMSVRPSIPQAACVPVLPHVTIRQPLNRFS